MEYVIFDLEWNSGYCKRTKGFINEIIELGAVKLDEQMNIIGQFSIFIRPEITKRLNHTVRELTQLTNEDLVHGSTFGYAVSKFKKFTTGCVIMSWSTSDLNALESNCEYYYKSKKIPFLERYADVQAYCQEVLNRPDKNQIALQSAAELLDISTDDIPLHRAVGDSILTARIMKRLYDAQRFEKYIQKADDEFYDRLNFHSTFIVNIDNPLIDKTEMFFDCDECTARCDAAEEWKVRNKAFYNEFLCPSCGKKFKGRIQFKLTYDGVTIIKRIVPEKNDEQENSE